MMMLTMLYETEKELDVFQVSRCDLLCMQVSHPRLPVNIQVHLLYFQDFKKKLSQLQQCLIFDFAFKIKQG